MEQDATYIYWFMAKAKVPYAVCACQHYTKLENSD